MSPSPPAFERPKEVILYGEPNATGAYQALLTGADIEVRCRIHESGRESAASDGVKPVAWAARNPKVPVVAFGPMPGAASGNAERPWKEMDFWGVLETLILVHKLPNRILHPAFLGRHVDLAFDYHNMLFSLPGSGTQLCAHVMRDVIKRASVPALRPEQKLMVHLLGNHFRTLHAKTEECLMREERVRFSYRLPYACHLEFFCLLENNRFVSIICPHFRYMVPPFYKTHEKLDGGRKEFYRRYASRLWATKRHPLDALLSFLCKHGNRYPESDGREAPSPMDLFVTRAKIVHSYFLAARDGGEMDQEVRYEDAFEDPVGYVTAVGQGLGVDVSPEQAAGIMEKYFDKPLREIPSYFRPGTEKWRQFFPKTHLDVLRDMGYGDLVSEMGYTCDFVGRDETGVLLWEQIRDGGPDPVMSCVSELRLTLRYGLPPTGVFGDVLQERDFGDGVRVFSDHAEAFRIISRAVENPVLRALLASGSI